VAGRVVHFEVPFDDADRARGFYRSVFDWDITEMPEMEYNMVSTGPAGDQGPTEPGYIGGGMFQRTGTNANPVLVIDVDDIDATLATIGSKGGSTVTGKEAVGDMGHSAYFKDSEGNLMGLWQSAG